MQQTINPSFEYDGDAVVAGGIGTVLGGLLVLFVLHRPGWLLLCGLVGGAIAGARSGFYDQSATNGFLATALGVVLLFPAVAFYRTVILPAATETGDLLFISITLSMVDVIAYGPLMCILGYLGGTLVDFLRRRATGRLSYE